MTNRLPGIGHNSRGLILPALRKLIAPQDLLHAEGVFEVEILDAHGQVISRRRAPNVVCTIGKNLAFTSFLAGSAYTVTGPFMGLISSTSFSTTAAADTMASHAGWLEAGSANAPTFTGNRPTCVWASASGGAIALSAALSFSITGTGTIEGCFIVFGSGAVNTVGSTAGTLWSAGVFTGGAQPVINGNTVNVSYSVAM